MSTTTLFSNSQESNLHASLGEISRQPLFGSPLVKRGIITFVEHVEC